MAGSSSDWPVHQLWQPPEGEQRTELDVLLFHGLQFAADCTDDAWSSTWTQRGNNDVCWPEEWLPFDLGEAVRIFSVSYNAHVETSPHDHVSEIAHNLLENLMDCRYEWHHPIVLIGHSFGGLVLKSLVVQLVKASTIRNPTNLLSEDKVQRAKVFLRNVRGVAFYSVPHAGSNIAEYVNKLLRCSNRNPTDSCWQAILQCANVFLRNMSGVAFHAVPYPGSRNLVEFVNKLLRSNIIHHPGILDNIQPWQGDMEELSQDFDDIVNENKINIYAFCEGRRMEQVGILVELPSARRLARSHFYKVEDANHVEVCKPPSKEHPSYTLLLQLIKKCREVARECDQALQEVHDLPEAMFGLESYMERVETLVTSEQSNADPQYVGVRGMGGVGKTLLLQRVYASEKIHDHFRGAKFIWCTVGQTPDIMALYQTLSAKLGLDPQMNLNLEDYKLKLHTQFKQKRVFLVLDDVWKEESFNSLDVARGKGSVTLLSTRNQDVFDRSPRHITQQNMEPLSKEDSWRLFCAHAFKPPSNVPFELEALALAQRIADECEGLPLALKVVGGAMSGKTNPKYEWEPLLKVLRESRMRDETVQKQLYERLKLGYDLLSEVDWRLKKCFHYFAAFPEDATIVFEEILFHWTGEGLVPAYDGDDPTADAFSLLKKLWERSFIESNGQFDSNLCYMLKFKIHDVMRDLAFYLLKNDCGTPCAEKIYVYRPDQNLDEVPKECIEILEALRLSLDTNKLEKLPETLYALKLVTLLLGRNPIISLPAKFASNFPNLSVLNLRDGKFCNLPDELGDLKNLIFLDLSNCYLLKTLPDTVRKLHKLKFLILDDCWGLRYLPSGVNDLTSLQVLHTVHCHTLRWAEHTLLNVVRGNFLDHVHPTVEASLVDICGLVHLTELTISANEYAVVQSERLPHNIFTLTKLKLLQVRLNIRALPAEMVYRCMQLQEFELCSDELKYLPSSFTRCGAFPTLIELTLCCYNLVKFPEVDEGAMSKLRRLNLTGCMSLKTLPLSLERLPSLNSLIVPNLDILKQSCKINCNKSAIWSMWHIQYYNTPSAFVRRSRYIWIF